MAKYADNDCRNNKARNDRAAEWAKALKVHWIKMQGGANRHERRKAMATFTPVNEPEVEPVPEAPVAQVYGCDVSPVAEAQ